MRKCYVIVFFLFLLSSCTFTAHIGGPNEREDKPISFLKLNSVYDITDDREIRDKPIIIFSSRDYVVYFAKLLKNSNQENFWVIPDDDFKPEDVLNYKKALEESKINHELKLANEGLEGKIEGLPITIIPKRNISFIVVEDPVLIVDVDFFFRINRNKITQPKSMDVITFFRTLDEYNIKPSKIILVRSLDINLPDWVQEFSYIIENAYSYWLKKEIPSHLLALDEADVLFSFAQYGDAYEVLKKYEKENEKNPYYFEKLFWAAMRIYNDTELLKAADKAYNLDGSMIRLYLEGVEYLLEKHEFYPALVLIKKAYEKEPWNKNVREKFEEVVLIGYSYYNQHGEDELFSVFKKEKERIDNK